MTAPGSQPNYFPKALLPNATTLGIRSGATEFEGATNIQATAAKQCVRFCEPKNESLLCIHTKAVTDNSWTNEWCCAPTKLYLQKEAAGSFAMWVIIYWLLLCDFLTDINHMLDNTYIAWLNL
jgi:hypothetical protein